MSLEKGLSSELKVLQDEEMQAEEMQAEEMQARYLARYES